MEQDTDLYAKVKNKAIHQKQYPKPIEVENIFISKKHLEEPAKYADIHSKNQLSNEKKQRHIKSS